MREGRRCWILDYADGAQFHMDVVPSLSNGQSARILLEARGLDARWTATAIAITDNEGPTYTAVTDDWPRSNPKGYGEWFKSRMAAALERAQTRAGGEHARECRGYSRLQGAHAFAGRRDDPEVPSRS